MHGSAIIHVDFASSSDLALLDHLAERLGGVRLKVEYRPCYGFLSLVERPHTATYLFDSPKLGAIFATIKARRL